MNPSDPRRLYKHEQAKRDIVEIYAYLSEQSERAPRQFLADIRKAFDLICSMPGIGRRWESTFTELRELRVTTVSKRFRHYLIYYRPRKDGVQIVTILHGARDLSPHLQSLDISDDIG